MKWASDTKEQFMPVRMRARIRKIDDRVKELQTAASLRRDLWTHSPVEVDPDHPLYGIHRDPEGRAYFEFAPELPEEVRRIVNEFHYTDRVELTDTAEMLGEECANCGNVAGPVRPPVCPNCLFRDISPCPICQQEVPRESYTSDHRGPLPLSTLQEPGATPVHQPDVPA
jgi:hypothetical protein